MQVSVENTGSLSRRMTIEVPAEQIDGKVQSRLKEIGRDVRLKGFRPGKVPARVVEQRYGRQIRREVASELMQESLRQALEEQEIRLAGSPQVDDVGDPDQGDLKFTASFEVYPDLDALDVSSLELSTIKAEIAEGDVDDMLDTLRSQKRTWNDVERAAADGDLVFFEFAVTTDDGRIPAEGTHRSGTIIGSGVVFEELEALLVGKAAGDKNSGKLDFPADFPEADVAGATGETEVEIIKVQEGVVPEVDDEFAKSFGIADVETLRHDVRENLKRELKNALSAQARTEVVGKLVAAHSDIELPQTMIEQEAESLQQQAQAAAQQAGADPAQVPAADEFKEQARERVAAGILLVELARQNEIEVDQGRVRDEVNSIAATYENPREIVSAYYGNPQLLSGVQTKVLEEQVVEWIIGQAKVTAQEMTFSEVMKDATGGRS